MDLTETDPIFMIKIQVKRLASFCKMSEVAPLGLPNIGSSCWLNSVLQILLRSNQFVEAITLHREDGKLHILIFDLIFCIRKAELSEEETRRSSLEDVMRSYKNLHEGILTIHPIFRESSLNDCHEVLTYLINALHQESTKLPAPSYSAEEKIIAKDFEGSVSNILLTTVMCQSRITSDKTTLYETFNTYFVEVTEGKDLQQMLDEKTFIHTSNLVFLSFIMPTEESREFKINNIIKINGKVYVLYGMIYYIIPMRHYIALIKRYDEKGWFIMNDAHTSEFSQDDLFNKLQSFPSIVAYGQVK